MSAVAARWIELGDGIFARRHPELDLTVGLVLGTQRCLVIDTRSDPGQGAGLAVAVRELTPLPWTVVITHGHYDHCLGTSAFLPCPVWGHRRLRIVGHVPTAAPSMVAPTRRVDEPAVLDLGGRRVTLAHLGRGHTDHDLIVHLPGDGVVFAGDLVEQGAPPDFEDADPAAWPVTLDALLALRPATVVPGHGEPVDASFVAAQRDELAAVAELCREVAWGGLDQVTADGRSPYPADVTRAAVFHYRFPA